MAKTLPRKDVVIIGLGWTGAILAHELTEAGKIGSVRLADVETVAIDKGLPLAQSGEAFAASDGRRAYGG